MIIIYVSQCVIMNIVLSVRLTVRGFDEFSSLCLFAQLKDFVLYTTVH